MCGLSGELRFDGASADVSAVTRMTATMEPRGPDGFGLWSQGSLALGHRRLKIIDLSVRASQPMVDAELGLAGVFNGCLYNYKDLREELRAGGYHFFSASDTEVLVKAYHRWGQRCVDHFKGMFAFAVVERDTGRLILGRDRLGIKPLYLTRDGSRLRFASTLPALLAGGGVDTDIDKTALHHYMTFHSVVPPPLTIITGVSKLPPATVRTFEPDGSTFDDYANWDLDFTRGRSLTPAEWTGAVLAASAYRGGPANGGRRASRRAAVWRAGLQLHRGAARRAGQRDLQTFSIGFADAGGESGDEFAYSDLDRRTFPHRPPQDPDRRLAATAGATGAVAAMSEPMVSHDAVAFYLLAQEVSRHVKVVQSGQGADEVFAGYDWYPPLADVPREEAAGAYSRVVLRSCA